MTVIIVAICEHGDRAIVASDRMTVLGASNSSESIRIDDVLDKIAIIGTNGALLHTGAEQDARTVVNSQEVQGLIHEGQKVPVIKLFEAVSTAAHRAAARKRSELIESKLGYTASIKDVISHGHIPAMVDVWSAAMGVHAGL